MRVTALIENNDGAGLTGEHGLSLWIESAGRHYLLDTGATGTCVDHAAKLGIDLSTAQAAFLSHSHFDHSGGFDRFFQVNHRAPVYVRSAACQGCYCRRNDTVSYIGVPDGLFQRHPDRFVFLEEDREIAPGVWLVADHVVRTKERAKSAGMLVQTETGFRADPFAHEQSLVLIEDEKLVIFNACCHAGVVEIVREIRQRFGGYPIAAVIGGFHLMGADATTLGVSEEAVLAVGQGLVDLGVEQIWTGHCTGQPAYQLLHEQLGERVQKITTAAVMVI